MNLIKDKIIKWSIRQIVGDAKGSYADMRYLEDVLENEFGEQMFIFSHRIVRPNLDKMNAYNEAQKKKHATDVSTGVMMSENQTSK